jgi:hypothetical protein
VLSPLTESRARAFALDAYEPTRLEDELLDVGAPLAQELIFRLRWSIQPSEEQLAAALAEIEQAARSCAKSSRISSSSSRS